MKVINAFLAWAANLIGRGMTQSHHGPAPRKEPAQSTPVSDGARPMRGRGPKFLDRRARRLGLITHRQQRRDPRARIEARIKALNSLPMWEALTLYPKLREGCDIFDVYPELGR